MARTDTPAPTGRSTAPGTSSGATGASAARTDDAAEFVYALPGSPGGGRPGTHGSRAKGPGLEFSAHGRLMDHPDPRRLDLRASLRSVPREWLVRVNRQRGAVTLQAVVDVSASMHFGTSGGKLGVVRDFLVALGRSAFRGGDRVGLATFDDRARETPWLPPRAGRGTGYLMAAELDGLASGSARRGGLEGLAACAARTPGEAALVFVVSDFHFPLAGVGAVLERFAATAVVPLVVHDPAELEPPAEDGWLSVVDAESGRRRSLWLRESTRRRWREGVAARREAIDAAFVAHDVHPFHVTGRFDAEALSRHFMEKVG